MRRVALVLALLLATSTVATVGAVAQTEQRSADLAIDQPHYIDSDVSVSSINGTQVYEAEGEALSIRPRNFDPESVVSFGVEESSGSLSYDREMDQYRFEASADGTYRLYWVTNETRVRNETVGNETVERTESVRVQYSASLRVEVGDRQHIPADELESQREDAANWSEWSSEVKSERVAGPDADIEEESQLAVDLLRLRHHPLSALTGNFTEILLTLFITLGGLFVLLLFSLYHYASRRSDIKFRHRRESLDAERADLEDQLLEYDQRERLSSLEGMDWNDIFPDDVARAFREAFGETVLDGYLTIQEILLPSNLIRDRLSAMSDEGYVAVVKREPVATDGGEPEAAPVRVAYIAPIDEVDEDSESVSIEDPTDELLDALSWDDPELRSFDLPSHEVDQSSFETELVGPSIEDLIEEYEVEMRQFEGNKDVFAEYVLEFLASVHNHDFTDEDGRIKPIRYSLNLFLRTARLLDEKHGETPLAGYQAEYLEYLLANYDRDEEISQYVDEVEEGKYA